MIRQDIRSLRQSTGLSLSELAVKASIDVIELKKVERGLTVPSKSFITQIASVLGVEETVLNQAHLRLINTVTPGEGYVTAKPGQTFICEPRTPLKSGIIPILDLFCGTGGFSHGFERTGKFQVICGIDLLPDRIETFAANHTSARAICADIRQVPITELCRNCPSPEIIIGGPPCQGFSSIRPFRKLTESDPRNTLFEYFALVVDALRPSWFVLENVVGILTNQEGKIFKKILSEFESIGYRLSWKILNGVFYGLPQRRERFVLVGSRDGKDFCWPEPTHFIDGIRSMAGRFGQNQEMGALFCRQLKKANTVMDAIHDLPELHSGESTTKYKTGIRLTEYEQSMRGNNRVLTLHDATRHSPKMLEIIKYAGSNRAALPEGMVTSGFSTCYSRLEPDLPAVTLTVNFVHPASNKCIHPYQNRALTPREGARLQGFSDDFMFIGSRAQVVKQIGNAVPPLIGRVIAESFARGIG